MGQIKNIELHIVTDIKIKTELLLILIYKGDKGIAISFRNFIMSGQDSTKTDLNPATIKGFVCGVLFSHINKRFMLAAVAGTVIGLYAEQNVKDLPNVEIVGKEWFETLKSALKPKK